MWRLTSRESRHNLASFSTAIASRTGGGREKLQELEGWRMPQRTSMPFPTSGLSHGGDMLLDMQNLISYQ